MNTPSSLQTDHINGDGLDNRKEKFEINPEALSVKIPAKKKGVDRGPFFLRTDLPYVELIIDCIKNTKSKNRIFPFSRTTGWLIVKRINSKIYPHTYKN